MLELGGRTLLSRLVESLEEHVDRIHVVVGYREELVINLCSTFHRRVVIVRNPDYRTTNTVQSMALGARGLAGKTLFLDGDLIIHPDSLRKFINKARNHELLAAIAPSRSENPVNVDLVSDPQCNETKLISAFTRESGRDCEWANVVSGPARMLDGAMGYVYERLEDSIPLPASMLDLREIDTVLDLEKAKEFAQAMDENR
ncbi:NTP transferase domain-containing protein [Pseudoxanthomonas sp.]|jgi:choline kinase|uniref:NTP transferase domain-containing protein n=1 Tax=Pseudoxanthomonas sp. TaxID=1871049 RepID=UPI002E0EE98F|nr:NTP transferase domain-containing protein [Pseudoxanthomonas sp.]